MNRVDNPLLLSLAILTCKMMGHRPFIIMQKYVDVVLRSYKILHCQLCEHVILRSYKILHRQLCKHHQISTLAVNYFIFLFMNIQQVNKILINVVANA